MLTAREGRPHELAAADLGGDGEGSEHQALAEGHLLGLYVAGEAGGAEAGVDRVDDDGGVRLTEALVEGAREEDVAN